MKKRLADTGKYALTVLGPWIDESFIFTINSSLNYLNIGRWMKTHGYQPGRRFGDRYQLFDWLASSLAEKRVLYLEFGVYHGHSMAYWSRLLKNPGSHLHGFDSFEGLPEAWNTQIGAGLFSTGGVLPAIDDPRVAFFKGWFADTLPGYAVPDHDQLIVNIDADLYSSSQVVLEWLGSRMAVGTLLYFDEFSDRFHELRAFDEFVAVSGLRFELVGATRTLTNVAFRRIA
jgi:hypothetical protein